MDRFTPLLEANVAYAEQFQLGDLEARAARGLAVVTCMDSRIEPLQMLGLEPGDAKILRNAGARISDDVVRTLVLATEKLGVDHVAVVIHTNCAGAAPTEAETLARLAADIELIHAEPRLAGMATIGLRYDVRTGRLEEIVPPRVGPGESP